MKPFITDHHSVVYQINDNEEVEVAHIELEGEDINLEPQPKQINRALAAYLAVHQKRNDAPK